MNTVSILWLFVKSKHVADGYICLGKGGVIPFFSRIIAIYLFAIITVAVLREDTHKKVFFLVVGPIGKTLPTLMA